MNQRLNLVRKTLRMTQTQMAEVLGIGQNAYSMIERGKIGLTTGNRIILESKLQINQEYLLFGAEPMLLDTNSTAPSTSPQTSHRGVPFFTKQISATPHKDKEFSERDIDYYIDYEPFNDCTFYRPVFSQTMTPRYNPGDTIACKAIHSKNNIMYGECYLCIIDNEGDTFETLQTIRQGTHPSEVILTPLNSSFDPRPIPLHAICKLYHVRGKIERTN